MGGASVAPTEEGALAEREKGFDVENQSQLKPRLSFHIEDLKSVAVSHRFSLSSVGTS